MRWARPTTTGSCIPFVESVVYDYVAFLRSEKAPATRGQSLVEAVAFTIALLGIEQRDEIMSHRVEGATFHLWSQKRVLRPRDPFTAEMVAVLEEMTQRHADIRARVFTGFVCALTHMRCRASDAQRALEGPELDCCEDADPPVFHVSLETATDRVKTGQEQKRARRQYHLVGHAVGIRGNKWAKAWIQAREICGLDLETDGVLMPAPQRGGFGHKAMSNEEMTLWLRELLVQGGISASSIWNVGMHSPKVTLLSWCAKFGLDEETRTDLGGHVQSSDASVTAYSRDMLAGPLRKLDEVLEAVRNGVILPDSTRAGAWRKKSKEVVEDPEEEAPPFEPTSPVPLDEYRGEFEVIQDSPPPESDTPTRFEDDTPAFNWPEEGSEEQEKTEVAKSCSEDESEEGPEAEEDDDEEITLADLEDVDLAAECEDAVNQVVVPNEVENKPGIPRGGIWKHASRGTFHLHGFFLGRSEDRLVCCRAITKVYEKLESWPDEASGRCKMRFGAAEHRLKDLIES